MILLVYIFTLAITCIIRCCDAAGAVAANGQHLNGQRNRSSSFKHFSQSSISSGNVTERFAHKLSMFNRTSASEHDGSSACSKSVQTHEIMDSLHRATKPVPISNSTIYQLSNLSVPLVTSSSDPEKYGHSPPILGFRGVPFHGIPLPASFMGNIKENHTFKNPQCINCEIVAGNVDVYYWPDPAADTSCESIIGPGNIPLDFGGTTSGDTTYWVFTGERWRSLFTMTYQTLTRINGVPIRDPLGVDPWDYDNPKFNLPPITAYTSSLGFPLFGSTSIITSNVSHHQHLGNHNLGNRNIAVVEGFTL